MVRTVDDDLVPQPNLLREIRLTQESTGLALETEDRYVVCCEITKRPDLETTLPMYQDRDDSMGHGICGSCTATNRDDGEREYD